MTADYNGKHGGVGAHVHSDDDDLAVVACEREIENCASDARLLMSGRHARVQE